MHIENEQGTIWEMPLEIMAALTKLSEQYPEVEVPIVMRGGNLHLGLPTGDGAEALIQAFEAAVETRKIPPS